jgi:hypothetical protein
VQKKQKEMSSTDENWEGAERLRLNLPGEWIGRVGKVQLKAADPSAIIASVSGCPCAALPCTLKKASPPPGTRFNASRPHTPASPCDRR